MEELKSQEWRGGDLCYGNVKIAAKCLEKPPIPWSDFFASFNGLKLPSIFWVAIASSRWVHAHTAQVLIASFLGKCACDTMIICCIYLS